MQLTPSSQTTDCARHRPRRQQERRSNPFAFNSDEWVALVQQHYQMWPKQDRRRDERRAADRRKNLHKSAVRHNRAGLGMQTERPLSPSALLSDEEKQMILALYAKPGKTG